MGEMMAMYHPIDDSNHCLFRMLLLSYHLYNDGREANLETFRMMDFYCLFPSALSEIKLPREFSKYKKAFQTIQPQFEIIPNKAGLYDRLRHVQNNALGCMVSLGFFDRSRFLDGLVVLTSQPIPANIANKISESPIAVEEWFKFLIEAMPNFPSEGKNGWKARTQLGEFRYDPA
jgi:hypothetical protein